MTIKINEADLLALLGENGEHWLKGSWSAGDDMCLHGAIRRCSPFPGDAFLIEQVATLKGWGTDWNDDKATTWPQLRERLGHVEVTDDDLAETFGPQWPHIVALVRRAATLTSEEALDLAAAWGAAWDATRDAAWDAAWGAAWGAAWDAARDATREAARDATREAARDATREAARDATREAAWDAAWGAAWEAVRGAAWDAARDAAVALVVRDLIDQHEFTREHYDVLTGPWVTVIGPVHPDDEARRG